MGQAQSWGRGRRLTPDAGEGWRGSEEEDEDSGESVENQWRMILCDLERVETKNDAWVQSWVAQSPYGRQLT